jgi:hypothetical protein
MCDCNRCRRGYDLEPPGEDWPMVIRLLLASSAFVGALWLAVELLRG